MSARPARRMTEASVAHANIGQSPRLVDWYPATVEQIDFGASDVSDPPSTNFILCLVRRGQAEASFGFGERRWSGRLLPGMFAPITPPYVMGEIRLGAPQRHIVVTFASSMVASVLGCSGEDLGSVHDHPFRDPLLSQICLSLLDSTAGPASDGTLFREYALAALITGLARQTPGRRVQPSTNRVLSNREWALVNAFIGDRLDGDLSLATLAGLVEMGQHAFIRAFKARCGHSPHQFILQTRLERARILLADPRLSLAEVALQVGFADQAHMTSTFSRLTGGTPGRLRRHEAGRRER